MSSSTENDEPKILKIDERNVTDAVLQQMRPGTKNERLATVMDSLVRHLHDFAREVDLTPAEWMKAIEFLTQTGQKCSATRQEFILLSDILGFSSLVNKLHDKREAENSPAYHLDEAKSDDAAGAASGLLEPTQTSLLGPYYNQDSPKLELGSSLVITGDLGPNAKEVLLYGTVRNVRGEPIPNASLEIWQSDDEGVYDSQKDGAVLDMRGHFHSSDTGLYWCRTVVPLCYMIPLDGPAGKLIVAQGRHGYRPAHIHFLVGAKPRYREVVTALYLNHDEYIGNDTVFGVSSSLAVSVDESPAENAVLKEIRSVDKDPSTLPPAVIRFDVVLVESAEGDSSGRVGADPKQFMGH